MSIYVGIGGWTFEPWRGTFYPEKLIQKQELAYASSKLSSLEINGTYYSTFKTDSWMKWRDETPEDFVFAVKASRYCTNRKVLSEGGESFDRFLSQGLTLLGDKLGPINWQFMGTKKFDAEDFEGFLKLLQVAMAVAENGLALYRSIACPRTPSFMPASAVPNRRTATA